MLEKFNIKLRAVKHATFEPAEPIVFLVVRDDLYFLPRFFQHYRGLGVTNFAVYADRCGPEAMDFLCEQEKTTVFVSDHSYGDEFGGSPAYGRRRLPIVLKAVVPEQYFAGRWVLTVDADEFLIVPPPLGSIPALISALECEKQLYCTAPLVDLHPETLAARNHDRRLSPFEGSTLFDRGPYYVWQPGKPHPRQLLVGVRWRLLLKLHHDIPDKVRQVYGTHPIAPAANWKVPLLKHGCGIRRIGDHSINITPTGRISCALAHFKFYPDLDAKIATAVAERQYYNASLEYRFLKLAIDVLDDWPLAGPMTERFDGPLSFVRAKLLTPV
jgi:hypothetical protein